MTGIFAVDWQGAPFTMFGTAHLVTLGIIVAFNLWFLYFRNHSTPRSRQRFRYWVAGILLVNELSWHIWSLLAGTWTIQVMLPLHLCSIFVYLTVYMLITRSEKVYEYAYFLCIAGAMQALLTPDAGRYGFPHFRYFQTMISHGLLFSMPIYFTVVEGFRPTARSIRRVLIGANLYMLAVGLVDFAIGANYLYVAHKPPTASLLDVLPAWPWYLIYIEAIGWLMVGLLYLPFWIKDAAARRKTLSIQEQS